jgi:integrase/recombinase XerD
MPTKLSTTLKKIELVPNPDNARLIFEFHNFMMSNGSSERHQNNNLKAIISYANYVGQGVTLISIKTSQEILSFLDTKIKTKDDDPVSAGVCSKGFTIKCNDTNSLIALSILSL